MPLTLRIRKGVAADVRSAMHGFSRFVRAEIWVPHRLTVTVETQPQVAHQNQTAYGFFVRCRKDPAPEIKIGGGLAHLIDTFWGDRLAAIEDTVETFAHEVGHYEQWRDGLPVGERGIAVRTRNLLKRYDNWRADRG